MTNLLTKTDVCEILAISQTTLQRILAAGELNSVKIGRRLRFEPKEVERYIESCRVRQVRKPVLSAKNVMPGKNGVNGSGYYPGMKVV